LGGNGLNNLIIEKTYSTPYINFSSDTGKLMISGESFPENASRFYTPILQWIREYISETDSQETEMVIEVSYFNSSTSKVFLNIFGILEEAVEEGKDITVNWRCSKENESAIECGEEFKEDLEKLPFNIIEL
jgi:hypothetical protein